MTLLEQLRKYSSEGNIDFLRQGVKTQAEEFMELEVITQIIVAAYTYLSGGIFLALRGILR